MIQSADVREWRDQNVLDIEGNKIGILEAVYVLIGALAIQMALGSGGKSADREGALAQIAEQPFGKTMRWALVAGFDCMALWRASRAVLTRGPDRKTPSRLLDGGRALFYGFICWATATYAAGGGQGSSGNAQSKDWTASVLKLPYGQILVAAGGCLLIGIGTVLAIRAAMRKFLRQLDTAAMSPARNRSSPASASAVVWHVAWCSPQPGCSS